MTRRYDFVAARVCTIVQKAKLKMNICYHMIFNYIRSTLFRITNKQLTQKKTTTNEKNVTLTRNLFLLSLPFSDYLTN